MGKTSFVDASFMGENPANSYNTEGPMIRSLLISVNMVQYQLDIIDPLPEMFKYHAIICADAFLVMYSIIDEASLKEAEEKMNLIREKRRDFDLGVPIFLVGNKCDLEESRELSQLEGLTLASKYINCKFFESAGRFGVPVSTILQEIVQELLRMGIVPVKKPNFRGLQAIPEQSNYCIIL